MAPKPMFWLIEVEAYDYSVGFMHNADISGKVLIVSSQLWSIIRGSEVFSVLIGPGIFKGQAQKGHIKVDVTEFISALIFDPTRLRCDEPLPQVDIVSPEVIDPTGAGKQEEIVTVIRNLIMERGNILAGDPLATVRSEAGVPQTAHYEEVFEKINVSHVSGVQRARFILAGTNGPMYRAYVEHFEKGKFDNCRRTKVMATPFSRFASFVDIEVMANWQIVEKAGMDMKTGIEAVGEEYDRTLDMLRKDKEMFMFPP